MAEYHNQMLKEIDYKNDADAKPPYSYAALICLAMKDTKKKMTLSQIYKWIRDSFAYYRKADKSWQVWKKDDKNTHIYGRGDKYPISMGFFFLYGIHTLFSPNLTPEIFD